MNAANGAAVVVGVDGSPSALRAVRLAAATAARRGRALRVVHGFIWPLLRAPLGPAPGSPPGAGLREQATRLVDEAVAQAEAAQPGLRVTGEVIDGSASAVLVGESPTAALIVLGDRGLGGFAALMVGSVAVQVAAYAGCPVLVARGAERADGPVVVGVDGSAASQAAAEFAAEEAVARGVALRAVHAYRHPASEGPGDMQPLVYDEQKLRGTEHRVLDDAVAGLAGRWPGLRLERVLARRRPAAALTEAAGDAQLLVVGGTGHGELTGLLLGSVGHAVLHRADCPVAVVRAPA
ncbi:universal stress protein [Micromonospora sp. DT233]|uniref:universal stress protein n=1 Tax=Micromonospora sp. DT233 TaxID=3393432 RepID=UPI003CEA56E5